MELRECPFCGNKNAVCLSDQNEIERTDDPVTSPYYAVICSMNELSPVPSADWKTGCGATGGYRPTPEDAVDAWNTRATDAEITRLTAENARLTELTRHLGACEDCHSEHESCLECRDIVIRELTAELEQYRADEADGLRVRLPCKAERIKRAVQGLYESYGCLFDDVDLPDEYGDCRKGCFQCIVDALRKEEESAEAALKEQEVPHEP